MIQNLVLSIIHERKPIHVYKYIKSNTNVLRSATMPYEKIWIIESVALVVVFVVVPLDLAKSALKLAAMLSEVVSVFLQFS